MDIKERLKAHYEEVTPEWDLKKRKLTGGDHHCAVPVAQFSLDMDLICVHDSIITATEYINDAGSHANISMVLNPEIHRITARDYYWIRVTEDGFDFTAWGTFYHKVIFDYEMEKELILRKFRALEKINADEFNISKSGFKKIKPVAQIDFDMNIIRLFSSAYKASREIKCDVAGAVSGRKVTGNGYYWMRIIDGKLQDSFWRKHYSDKITEIEFKIEEILKKFRKLQQYNNNINVNNIKDLIL